MSKKSNTIFFMLGATVFNILVTILSFILMLLVYGRLIAPLLPAKSAALGLPIIFVGAIALAFFIYRYALKAMIKRVDVDQHFDPIFKPRRPPRRD